MLHALPHLSFQLAWSVHVLKLMTFPPAWCWAVACCAVLVSTFAWLPPLTWLLAIHLSSPQTVRGRGGEPMLRVRSQARAWAPCKADNEPAQAHNEGDDAEKQVCLYLLSYKAWKQKRKNFTAAQRARLYDTGAASHTSRRPFHS